MMKLLLVRYNPRIELSNIKHKLYTYTVVFFVHDGAENRQQPTMNKLGFAKAGIVEAIV